MTAAVNLYVLLIAIAFGAIMFCLGNIIGYEHHKRIVQRAFDKAMEDWDNGRLTKN
jgi:NADH:ubiquinone oxidoreductase subunit 3 (subunit A)